MIRPITLICWILALGAGLYLYRAKHEVELINQHIDQIAKQTADLRIESRGLLDEWIRLGEPEQLHKYSDEYLGLKTIAPGQFVRVGDLGGRLPPPQANRPDEPPQDIATQSPGSPSPDVQSAGVQAAEPAVGDADDVKDVSADDFPVPPIPPVRPPVTAVSLQGTTALPLQARPVTPRQPASQPEQETARPNTASSSPEPAATRAAQPARVADEPNAGTPKSAQPTAAEQRVGAIGPVPKAVQTTAPLQSRGLPPSQGTAAVQGLPPLQAQGSGRGSTQTTAYGQPSTQPASRPAEPRAAETVAAVPRAAQPTQAQTADQRTPPAAPPRSGSLLGIAHGNVPLPAPTPVNASWPGPAGGPPGSGR